MDILKSSIYTVFEFEYAQRGSVVLIIKGGSDYFLAQWCRYRHFPISTSSVFLLATATFRHTTIPQCHERCGSDDAKEDSDSEEEFDEVLAIIMNSVESDDMMLFFEGLFQEQLAFLSYNCSVQSYVRKIIHERSSRSNSSFSLVRIPNEIEDFNSYFLKIRVEILYLNSFFEYGFEKSDR